MTRYPLSSYKGERAEVSIGNVSFREDAFVTIAGPCSVESQDQILKTAETVSMLGASILRGGTYKYRKSPYTFSGLKEKGVDYLVGKTNKPVVLKRGYMATIEETLLAAEHIAKEANESIVLCERGIRCFDNSLRFTLDLAGAILLKESSKFPVIIDPSHATGRSNLVKPLCLAALAAGLNGIMVEVHPEPRKALSDSEQSLTFDEFADLMDSLSIFSKNENKITQKFGD